MNNLLNKNGELIGILASGDGNINEVIPVSLVNKIIQNRQLEKTFVNNLGIKTTKWAFTKTAKDVQQNKNINYGMEESSEKGN